MAITFPTTIDTLTNMTPTNSLGAEGHNSHHTDLNDAVEALEAKVGADSSAVTSSHDYKIATLETTDSTHTTNIATNATNIATNTTNIATNVTNIANLTTYIGDGWIPSGETWAYASADDPTYTFTITGDKTAKYSVGMKIKLTNGGTVKYFIISSTPVYSNPNTTITMYGGTDYDLANSAITNPYYSVVKSPTGFPIDPIGWKQQVLDTSNRQTSSPTQNVWYNNAADVLVVPIGAWRIYYEALLCGVKQATTQVNIQATLSKANNTEDDKEYTAYFQATGASATMVSIGLAHRQKNINLTSKTSYYLNIRTIESGQQEVSLYGGFGTTKIAAQFNYL
jgi:hypothetical protein